MFAFAAHVRGDKRIHSRFHCAPGGDNYLQNAEKFFANGMRGLEEIFGSKGLTGGEVCRGSRVFEQGLG